MTTEQSALGLDFSSSGVVEFTVVFGERAESDEWFISPSGLIAPLADLRLMYWMAADPDGPIEPWWYRRFRDQRLNPPHDRGPLVARASFENPIELVILVAAELAKDVAVLIGAGWGVVTTWEIGRRSYVAAKRRRKQEQRAAAEDDREWERRQELWRAQESRHRAQAVTGREDVVSSVRRRSMRYEKRPTDVRARYFADPGFDLPPPRPPD